MTRQDAQLILNIESGDSAEVAYVTVEDVDHTEIDRDDDSLDFFNADGALVGSYRLEHVVGYSLTTIDDGEEDGNGENDD